jgi:hypothetical protein
MQQMPAKQKCLAGIFHVETVAIDQKLSAGIKKVIDNTG